MSDHRGADPEHLVTRAIVPAAGRALRLASLGGALASASKEVLPVRLPLEDGALQPAALYLLNALAVAGVARATVVLREGKDDVRRILGESAAGVTLDYLLTAGTASAAHSVALALATAELDGCRVALGFPDILFTPRRAFAEVLTHLEQTGADVVLGLFPTRQAEKTDMVAIDGSGRVVEVRIKQPDAGLLYTWSLAVWSPRFSQFFLAEVVRFDGLPHSSTIGVGGPLPELNVGDILTAWLANGGVVEAVTFPDGSYHDIGSPEDLRRAGWVQAGKLSADSGTRGTN